MSGERDNPPPGSNVRPLAGGHDVLRVSARFDSTGTAQSFFGPLDPMMPLAPADVAGRILDYPVGYNLSQSPRAYEAISFPVLRQLADAWDLLRLLIETRKDQLCRMPWQIVPKKALYKKGDQEAPTAVMDKASELEAFFQQPDTNMGWTQWLRELLEDLFVLDAPTLYIRRTRGGGVFALEPIDGATIKRVIDPWGRTPLPPYPAYQQVLKGMPAVDYTTDDVIYRPRNSRTGKIYGFGPTEQLLTTVNIALRRQTWQTQYYTEGNIPEALIGVPDTWTPDQINAFQRYWDNMLEGNTASRRHAKFVPGGIAKTYIPTKEAELKNVFDEWLARVACYCFSISPAPFVSNLNRATAQSLKDASLEEGLMPIQLWIKELCDYVIRVVFKNNDVEFSWQEDEDADAATQATITLNDVKGALLTINEGRAAKGLQPFSDPLADTPLVWTTTGYVPLEQPEPPPPLLGHNGGPPMQGDGKDPKTDAKGNPIVGNDNETANDTGTGDGSKAPTGTVKFHIHATDAEAVRKLLAKNGIGIKKKLMYT